MSENTAGSRYEVSVAPRDVATAPSEDFAQTPDAESRLAQARVDGAREALTRFNAEFACSTGEARAINAFRDREYPAPSAHAGELRPCERNGPCIAPASCEAGETCYGRPAPTPEQRDLNPMEGVPLKRNEDIELYVRSCGTKFERVVITRDVARRIVALGSRPAQTAEG